MSGGIYWLASYPKSGNTWFRAFLMNLQSQDDQPVDINQLDTGEIASSRAWIDEVLGFDTADLTEQEIEALRPRVYQWSAKNQSVLNYHKIHDAYRLSDGETPLTPPGVVLGALYFVRNPLDVAISLANHNNSTVDEAIDCMADPYYSLASTKKRFGHQVRQRLSTWSSHVRSWADAQELAVKVVRYEDMKLRSLATFTDAARFLQLPDNADKITQALRNCDIKLLQQQEQEHGFCEKPPKVASFFRKGIVGDWQATLTSAQTERIVQDHFEVMRRFGYLDGLGNPIRYEHSEENQFDELEPGNTAAAQP